MENEKVKSGIKQGINDMAFKQLKANGLGDEWAKKGAAMTAGAATSDTGYGLIKTATKESIKKKTE